MIFNVGAGGASTADKVKYDNTESGLQSDNVQGAVDELNSSLTNISNNLTEKTLLAANVTSASKNSIITLNDDLSNYKRILFKIKWTSNNFDLFFDVDTVCETTSSSFLTLSAKTYSAANISYGVNIYLYKSDSKKLTLSETNFSSISSYSMDIYGLKTY